MRKPEEYVVYDLNGKPHFVYDKTEMDEYIKYLRGSEGSTNG